MKKFIKRIDRYHIMVSLLACLACFGGFIIPQPAMAEKSVADEIISLNVADKPLSEVLENISDAAGCQFKIDASWEDYPITASFKNEPLYRVLKRIFRDFNNAVIYGSDRTIKIIIYDEGNPSGKKAGVPVAIKPAEGAVVAQPYSDATAPQPEVQTPEDNSGAENVVQPSEEVSDASSETIQPGSESNEAKDESGETETEEKTVSLEAEQNESAPAQDSSQTETTESASDSSENPEKKDNSEESNQN